VTKELSSHEVHHHNDKGWRKRWKLKEKRDKTEQRRTCILNLMEFVTSILYIGDENLTNSELSITNSYKLC